MTLKDDTSIFINKIQISQIMIQYLQKIIKM